MPDGSITDGSIQRAEWFAVLALCSAASMSAILWSWSHGAMLNYGDAVAHLHIARRVFDAHQPRLTLLGSVWLPLPHILLLPFVQVYSWWASGFAGVIPSALAYLASCAGLYRLARRWLSPAAAALSLAFFAANPNLLYLQTTAMTEPLFLCEMVWITLWLVEWRASLNENATRSDRLQYLIAAALIAAVFTRYDGWIIALFAWTSMGIALARRGKLGSRAFWIASAFVVAAPIAWFIYNQLAFGDWLDFARGPYSAMAIEIRTAVPGYPPHPGWHNPWVSLIFFVKAAQMCAAALAWGNVLLVLSLFGTLWAWVVARRRTFAWAWPLWLPVPFYAYSISYGSVPIFLPVWWPHSWYNVRYGMELLPAFALSMGFAANLAINVCVPRELLIRPVETDAPCPVLAPSFWRKGGKAMHHLWRGSIRPHSSQLVTALLFALIALNVFQMLRENPLVYVEGTKNIHARQPMYSQVPPVLRALLARRPGAVILMDTSVYPEIVSLTGIPLRQTINESDLTIYLSALAAPAAHAPIVLAFDGDEIDQAVHAHPEGLTAIHRFTAPNQPSGTLYVSDTPDSSSLNNPPTTVIASLMGSQ